MDDNDHAQFVSAKTTNKSLVAIFQEFIQRSATRAIEERFAGVYSCLVAPPDLIRDPDNIPPVATAAAAASIEGVVDHHDKEDAVA